MPEGRGLHYLMAFQAFTDPVIFADREYRVRLFNPAAERLFEITAAQALGRRLEELIDIAGSPLSRREIRDAVLADGRWQGEVAHLSRTGQRLRLDWSIRRLHYPEFDLDGMIAVIHDITARQEADEALRQSESLYRTTIDGLEEWLHVVDPHLRIIMMNRALLEVCAELGIGRDVVGRLLRDVFPFLTDEVMAQYERVFATGKSVTTVESTSVADRTYVTETKKVPVFEAGRVARVVTLMHDITAVKQTENELAAYRRNLEQMVEQRTQELTRANERLTREIEVRRRVEEDLREAKLAAELANEAKSEFLANMSHEVRTPLNGVIGMLRFLTHTRLTPAQREYAEMANRSAELLLTVINDILDYSRIAAGRLEVESLPFDLQLTVEETAHLLAEAAHDKGVDLVVRYAPTAPRRVLGDANRVRQVVANLLSNAVKFTAEGHVLLEVDYEPATDRPARFVIQVQDTGVGIPPDQMHRLFEKFSQLESADGERTHGTGLGLAISKRLVELMGGAVEVRSRPGLGSTFTVTLPLPPAESLPHAPPAEAAFRDRRALVVARHPLSRQTLDDELRALGLRPEVAADNDAARRLLAAAVEAGDPFAVVLIDHAPVECDGIALARTVKATEALRQLPLILIAPDSLIGKTGRVETLGFAAHLSRPVRQSKLPEALRAVWSERAAPPVAPPRRPEPADEPLAPREGQTIEAHVLLVEDDKVSQIVATKMLQAIGCKVELAANGQEALEMLARTPYDLVLMDARMPVMDGYETTRELRRRAGPNQRTPVIAMTAHALQGAREKCLAAGMDDYVTKPVDPRVLRDAVRRWTKPK